MHSLDRSTASLSLPHPTPHVHMLAGRDRAAEQQCATSPTSMQLPRHRRLGGERSVNLIVPSGSSVCGQTSANNLSGITTVLV